MFEFINSNINLFSESGLFYVNVMILGTVSRVNMQSMQIKVIRNLVDKNARSVIQWPLCQFP